MEKLKWNLAINEVAIYDKAMDMALVFSKEMGIYCFYGENKFPIALSSIHHAFLEEPKIFKKGALVLYNENGLIRFCCGELEISVVVEFNKKYKKEFYLIYSLLKDNGVEIRLLRNV